MSNKNYRYDRNDKFQQFDDDFEDFGYEVKNIRRQGKKKVTKFKQRDDEYYDSYWSGTVGVAVAPDIGYITFVAEKFMTDNYFNHNIVQRHDDHMWLNNSMAEVYDFCLNVATICDNKADAAWWYSMKKGHLCYDVWQSDKWHTGGCNWPPSRPYYLSQPQTTHAQDRTSDERRYHQRCWFQTR